MNRHALCLIAYALACAPLTSLGSESDTFEVKGISVGMPVAKAQEHFGNRLICKAPVAGDKVLPSTQFCYVDWENNPNYAEQSSFAGHEGSLHFFTYEDRIVMVLPFSVTPGEFETISKGMTEKYGKPVLQKTMLQNGLGMKFENVTAVWVRPRALIRYVKFAGDIESSDLKFVETEYAEKLQALLDATNDVKAKDM